MWVLIVLILYQGGDQRDVSQDVNIITPVKTFETEEECHDHLRTLHELYDGSSLKWDKIKQPKQLLLLSSDKILIRKCIPASIKFP